MLIKPLKYTIKLIKSNQATHEPMTTGIRVVNKVSVYSKENLNCSVCLRFLITREAKVPGASVTKDKQQRQNDTESAGRTLALQCSHDLRGC